METLSPHDRFAALFAAFDSTPAVSQSERRGFGQGGLMRNGKLFARLRGDALLLKLPAGRVAHLIAAGHGAAFDANKGKPMKEWVLANALADWPALAREAAAFVS